MRFLFRGDQRRQELDELNARIRDLRADIRRIEHSIEPAADSDESSDTYRSVQRLRKVMLQDDLQGKTAELEQLTRQAAELEARLSRGRRAPETPTASIPPAPAHRPETPAGAAQSTPPGVASPPGATDAARQVTPLPQGPADSSPAQRPPTVPGKQPRVVETTAGWPGARWIFVVLTLGAMSLWIAGALYYSGITGPALQHRVAGIGSAPAVIAVVSPSPPVSLPSVIAAAPASAPTVVPTAIPTATAQPATAVPVVVPAEAATTAPEPVATEVGAVPTAPPATAPNGEPAAGEANVQPPSIPTIAPTVAPSIVPIAVLTALPTAVPTTPPPPARTATIAAPAPASDRPLGNAMVSAPSGFSGALLRPEPNLRAQSQRYLPNGTMVEVLDGANVADDYNWSRVRTEDGIVGWIVSLTIGR